ncbi:MAG: hypothetical protein AAF242_13545, partial [Bacteroidota bacterium]
MKNILFNLFFTLLAVFSVTALSAQAALNATGAAPDASAMLDIVSTGKGVLIPRMSESQRDNISSPATGLLIFQTDEQAGFYYFNGSTWVPFATGGSSALANINGDPSTVLGLDYNGPAKTDANNSPSFRFTSGEGYFIDFDNEGNIGTSWIWYDGAGCTGTAYADATFYAPGAVFASPGDGSLFFIDKSATINTSASLLSRYIVDTNVCQTIMNSDGGFYYELT